MTTLFKHETQGRPVTFLDEADQYDNETIRKHWQTSFPELGNCQAETKAAPKEGKLKEVTAEGEEVEVDKVVTFVKKVGTKGADGDQVDALAADAQRRFDAWYKALVAHNAELDRQALEAFGPVVGDQVRGLEDGSQDSQALEIIRRATALDATPEDRQLFWTRYSLLNDPARQRLIDAAPRLLRACMLTLKLVRVHQVYDKDAESILRRAIADAIGEEGARLRDEEWIEEAAAEFGFDPAVPGGDAAIYAYAVVRDGNEEAHKQMLAIDLKLAVAAPALLAELQAQRDLLATLLEVAIFVNGNRQAVIDRLARLEAVIESVTGETGTGSE
jgi:hypothetical protein